MSRSARADEVAVRLDCLLVLFGLVIRPAVILVGFVIYSFSQHTKRAKESTYIYLIFKELPLNYFLGYRN